MAAKSYYFGVGGSVAQFRQLVRADSRFECSTFATFEDGLSNRREVLRVAWATASAPAAADTDVPALFATQVPAGGLTTSLQAVAALIDEEVDHPSAPVEAASTAEAERSSGNSGSNRKRSRASMGETQVHLALASCDELPSQRRCTTNSGSGAA